MNIFKDSKYLFISNLVLLAMSLATGVLTARFLGPEGKGEFYLMLQMTSLASLVLSGGLGPSYQYHLKKGLLDRSSVLSHMVAQSIGVSLLLLLGLALLDRMPQGIADNVLPQDLAGLIVAAIILNILILYTNSILMTVDTWIQTSSLLSVASSAVYVGLLTAFVWGFEWGIAGAVAAYLSSLLVRLIPTISRLVAWKPYRLRPAWTKHSPTLFAFGVNSFLCNIMLSSVFRVDVFIINALLGVGAVGVYSVAVSFAELALMAPNAIGVVLFAHLPGLSQEKQIAIMGRASRVTFFLAFVGGSMLAVISHPLVTLSMGDQFAGAVVPLLILIPGLVMMSVNYVFANYYSSQGKPLISAYCFGFGLVVNVAVNFISIPRMGINGAALASSIAYTAITISFLAILWHQHRLGVRKLFILNANDVAVIADKFHFIKRCTGWFSSLSGKL